jgi:hypothetical protein
VLGIIGCSLSLLGLAGFGGFALLALALAPLDLGDLPLVVFQRTTDTFLEVNPRHLAAAFDRGLFAVLFAAASALTAYEPSGSRPDLTR